jgi:hypothetical protein
MPPRITRPLHVSDLKAVGGLQIYSPTALQRSLSSTATSQRTNAGESAPLSSDASEASGEYVAHRKS